MWRSSLNRPDAHATHMQANQDVDVWAMCGNNIVMHFCALRFFYRHKIEKIQVSMGKLRK